MAGRRDPEKVVREIKRKTRRKFSSEEKIRIVLEGLRGEETIAELCRREGINPNLYYNCTTPIYALPQHPRQIAPRIRCRYHHRPEEAWPESRRRVPGHPAAIPAPDC